MGLLPGPATIFSAPKSKCIKFLVSSLSIGIPLVYICKEESVHNYLQAGTLLAQPSVPVSSCNPKWDYLPTTLLSPHHSTLSPGKKFCLTLLCCQTCFVKASTNAKRQWASYHYDLLHWLGDMLKETNCYLESYGTCVHNSLESWMQYTPLVRKRGKRKLPTPKPS
jgi:hypothetical protein